MASSGSKDGQLQIKVVLLGAASVGKTCLVSRYVHDRFTSNYQNVSGCSLTIFGTSETCYLCLWVHRLHVAVVEVCVCCVLTMEIGPVSSMRKLLIKL